MCNQWIECAGLSGEKQRVVLFLLMINFKQGLLAFPSWFLEDSIDVWSGILVLLSGMKKL